MKRIPEKFHLSLLLLITAASRIPFIFDGFGVEEDSWGLVVNAFQMKQLGHYVASRFPGHPVQEYFYRLIYDQPAWMYNALSVIMSLIAVGFFYKALRKMEFRQSFLTALAFSFVPCFFISGTYTIDFAWSLAFVMASFYFLLDGKNFLCGIMIGLAIGCRITSGIFIIPWAILLFSKMDISNWLKKLFIIGIPAVLIGIVFYFPAYRVYGTAFFDYSDQFPYPPMTKVLYKASIGVFGLIGMLALLVYFIPAIKAWRKKEFNSVILFSTGKLLFASVTIILLLIISYLRLPQKSGYLIPVIPFILLVFGSLLKEKQFRYFCMLFILSPFIFSVNLTDSLRGSEHSAMSMTFHVSGQEIFIDPVSGPIFSERSKRINKMKYVDEVLAIERKMDFRHLIISGWWFNEIQTHFLQSGKSERPEFTFYSTNAEMDSARSTNAEIFYLPEQDLYNDQMFGQCCTDSIAKPFPAQ